MLALALSKSQSKMQLQYLLMTVQHTSSQSRSMMRQHMQWPGLAVLPLGQFHGQEDTQLETGKPQSQKLAMQSHSAIELHNSHWTSSSRGRPVTVVTCAQ